MAENDNTTDDNDNTTDHTTDDANDNTTDPQLGLDPDELDLMNRSRRWHRTHGRPEKAHLIEIAINKNWRLSEEQRRALLRIDEAIPEVEVDPSIVMPPRTGKGASIANWQSYARAVTDWEPEVINDAKMSEIISMLEANGIIPTIGDEQTE